MKIYINDVIKNISFDEISSKQIIYTTEGVFCNYKKKLTKIEWVDAHSQIIKEGYTFLIDSSKENYGETILHIPYDHLYCEETYSKKNIGFNIYYVKCSYFDQTSYYFETDVLDEIVFNEIISFLSVD